MTEDQESITFAYVNSNEITTWRFEADYNVSLEFYVEQFCLLLGVSVENTGLLFELEDFVPSNYTLGQIDDLEIRSRTDWLFQLIMLNSQ